MTFFSYSKLVVILGSRDQMQCTDTFKRSIQTYAVLLSLALSEFLNSHVHYSKV